MSDKTPSYKLYHPGTIAGATAMGSPLAGAIIMALNYRRLDQPKAAWWKAFHELHLSGGNFLL